MCEAVYIDNTQQAFKKKVTVVSPISYASSKTGKNQFFLF